MIIPACVMRAWCIVSKVIAALTYPKQSMSGVTGKDDDLEDIYEEGSGPRVALVTEVVPGLEESNWNNSVEKR